MVVLKPEADLEIWMLPAVVVDGWTAGRQEDAGRRVRCEARGWAKQQRRLAARNGGGVWKGTGCSQRRRRVRRLCSYKLGLDN
jgi:hypothetical protein